jgi:hypothetical protein
MIRTCHAPFGRALDHHETVSERGRNDALAICCENELREVVTKKTRKGALKVVYFFSGLSGGVF